MNPNNLEQLVKIFLEKTNPQNPAARRDIKRAKERAKKSGQSFKRGSLRRGLAADTARVRRGEKPRHTTKAQGQEAMAADPDHPATRRRVGESAWNTYKNLALVLEKDWIQGAVDPEHKGFCTPMTKETCTPRRKALAKRFKKAGRKEKRSGGTGWEGKV